MKKNFLDNFQISKYLPKTGIPAGSPGTVTYVGTKREAEIKVHLMSYNKDTLIEETFEGFEKLINTINNENISWINITGVHDESIIKEIGENFNIHPLVLEDIANTTQRPKIEEYDDFIFLIIKMIYIREDTNDIYVEQVSLIINKNTVISLQELEGDVFQGIKERIRTGKGKIRKMGSDYLMYTILDAVIDQYFSVMERISDTIETLEETLMLSPDQELLQEIYKLKKDLVFVRKSIWPMREIINGLQHTENELIQQTTLIYLRDVYDHTIQIIDTVETFRDIISSMIDLYLSTVSQKMNEVMKVLTIFAAIFIPLTFIAGVYGMNFEYMPELNYKWSYPIWWGVIILLSVIMIVLFKKKSGYNFLFKQTIQIIPIGISS